MAHELGHTLGAPDLYGRTVSNGKIETLDTEGYLGELDIMGHHWTGAHLDSFLKFRFDWLDPEIITPHPVPKNIRLSPVYENPKNALLVRPDVSGHVDEFYLLEVRCKQSNGWDGQPTEFDKNLNDNQQGVFIYHINAENATGITVDEKVEAKPRIDLEGEPAGSPALIAFKPGNQFSPPESNFYDDGYNGLDVNILSESDDSIYTLEISWAVNWGEAEMYINDGQGNIDLFKKHIRWRRTWSMIIPGNFGGTSNTDLLIYDPTGEAEFYASDGQGNIHLLKKHTGWRRTWSMIIPGNFGGNSYTDLLFYDKGTGS